MAQNGQIYFTNLAAHPLKGIAMVMKNCCLFRNFTLFMMAQNGQKYFTNLAAHTLKSKIFKVCLTILRHYALKGSVNFIWTCER